MHAAVIKVLVLAGLVWASGSGLAESKCPDMPGPCSGCGCKGSPGYRSIATGRCVSHKNLYKICGDPPSSSCVFENAPGTGGNRECALGKTTDAELKRRAARSPRCRK